MSAAETPTSGSRNHDNESRATYPKAELMSAEHWAASERPASEQARASTGVAPDSYVFRSVHRAPEPAPNARPFSALRDRPGLSIGLILAFALLSLIPTFASSPRYKAESRLLVGSAQTVDTQALQSFQVATQQLAATNSRLITSDQVLSAIAAKTHISRDDVQNSVQASPIPETSIIRVEAEAGSESVAVQLADAAAGSLATAVTTTGDNSSSLLSDYQKASTAYAGVVAARDQQQTAVNQAIAANRNPATITALQQTLTTLQGQVSTAKLKLDSLQQAYAASQRGVLNTVDVIERARSTGNDRVHKLELNLVIGLFVGLIVAVAASTYAARRRTRRPAFR